MTNIDEIHQLIEKNNEVTRRYIEQSLDSQQELLHELISLVANKVEKPTKKSKTNNNKKKPPPSIVTYVGDPSIVGIIY